MDDWPAPFSGTTPHPPGTVCNAMCTPWCYDGAVAPEPREVAVPEPRAATPGEIAESSAPIL